MPTTILTSLALLAFAANAILCRFALGESDIDPASFTSIRLLSGAFSLFMIINLQRQKTPRLSSSSIHASTSHSSITSIYPPLMLFTYASTFSFAYMSLNTGTGALILYGAVQISMLSLSIINGHRPQMSEWLGMSLAFTGFVYLMLPGADMPSLQGFILMSLSGIAWGIYSILGKQSQSPLFDTQRNFLYALPLTLILSLSFISQSHLSSQGILLAITSGALASGVGYVLWYAALTGLSGSLAAAVQLLVPIFAALGGVLWMNESISTRFITAAIMVLGGIFLISYRPQSK
ncbi:MAG: DMT family transporter [Zetaproteobacteria bacterium]|nr:DMT family transporter [Zetaproteobacteria bacterium]